MVIYIYEVVVMSPFFPGEPGLPGKVIAPSKEYLNNVTNVTEMLFLGAM